MEVIFLSGERVIAGAMKDQIKSDFSTRYEDTQLNIVLNTATYLDPWFKDTFVAMEEEVKERLLQKCHEASVPQVEQVQTGEQHQQQEEGQGGTKKRKTDLNILLCKIHFKRLHIKTVKWKIPSSVRCNDEKQLSDRNVPDSQQVNALGQRQLDS